jgi:hypothetical protein
MWNWGSPIGWAIFLVGAGLFLYLLAQGIKALATIEFMESVLNKKR